MKILLFGLCLLLTSCSNERVEPPAKHYYRLELMSQGKVVRVINKTPVVIWRSTLIQFTDESGADCYWGGDFFAKEVKASDISESPKLYRIPGGLPVTITHEDGTTQIKNIPAWSSEIGESK